MLLYFQRRQRSWYVVITLRTVASYSTITYGYFSDDSVYRLRRVHFKTRDIVSELQRRNSMAGIWCVLFRNKQKVRQLLLTNYHLAWLFLHCYRIIFFIRVSHNFKHRFCWFFSLVASNLILGTFSNFAQVSISPPLTNFEIHSYTVLLFIRIYTLLHAVTDSLDG